MTDMPVDTDDISFSTDDEWGEDDEALDFEHLTPADGAYEVTFRTVIFSRDERKDEDGFNLALRIQVQLSTDDEFNGMQLSNYIWLGRDGTFSPSGRRQLKAMAEACGIEVAGSDADVLTLAQLPVTWARSVASC